MQLARLCNVPPMRSRNYSRIVLTVSIWCLVLSDKSHFKAGAASIKLRTKKGGLDLIQIEDDGCGIASADLPLAGVRFATSKLR